MHLMNWNLLVKFYDETETILVDCCCLMVLLNTSFYGIFLKLEIHFVIPLDRESELPSMDCTDLFPLKIISHTFCFLSSVLFMFLICNLFWNCLITFRTPANCKTLGKLYTNKKFVSGFVSFLFWYFLFAFSFCFLLTVSVPDFFGFFFCCILFVGLWAVQQFFCRSKGSDIFLHHLKLLHHIRLAVKAISSKCFLKPK